MIKRITLFSLLMVLAVTATAFAAPDRTGRLDLGVNAGGAWLDGDLDDTGYYSAQVSAGVLNWEAISLGLGVEAGWWETETSASNNEEVGTAVILGDIIARFQNVHESIVPYAVLGLGYGGTYVTNEPTLSTAAANAIAQGDDVDDSGFAWKIGGGLDWFFNPNWALNFEVAYVSTDVDQLVGTSVSDTDFTTVTGGIKVIF